jgi:RecA/RadA recombinase
MGKVNSLENTLVDLSNKYKMYLGGEFLDTGFTMLNMVMGGGLPMNKMIEIFSESGYGKTTIVLSICKGLCRQGHKVLYIDAEGSIDQLAESMGFYKENLVWDPKHPDRPFVVVQTSYFEDVEEILEKLIPKYDEKGYPMDSDFRLVVIDSVAMLAPKEYRGDMGEKESLSIGSSKPGVRAKLMTAFCNKFNGYKTAYNMSFLFINQLREDLSMSFIKDSNKTTGGKALNYAEDIRLRLVARKGGSETKKVITTAAGEKQEIVVGREVGIKAVKNKVTYGGIVLPLYVSYGEGVSNLAAMPYILPHKTVVTKEGKEVPMLVSSGGWYTLTFNVLELTKEGTLPKDSAGNYKLNVIDTKSIRCNGRDQLRNAINENRIYIYPTIKKDDFKLLVEEGADDGEYDE